MKVVIASVSEAISLLDCRVACAPWPENHSKSYQGITGKPRNDCFILSVAYSLWFTILNI
jgi:hypothetical protein